MPYEPPPELAALSLSEIAALVADRKLPPVEGWAPAREGDSEMRIAADGKWFHQGSEIARPAMVRAFSTLLSRDEHGQHWLVSPFEKLAIVKSASSWWIWKSSIREIIRASLARARASRAPGTRPACDEHSLVG